MFPDAEEGKESRFSDGDRQRRGFGDREVPSVTEEAVCCATGCSEDG